MHPIQWIITFAFRFKWKNEWCILTIFHLISDIKIVCWINQQNVNYPEETLICVIFFYNYLPVYRKNVEVFYEHKHAIVDRIFGEKSFFPRFPFRRSTPYTHHLESLLLHTAQAIGLVMNRILSRLKVWREYFYTTKKLYSQKSLSWIDTSKCNNYLRTELHRCSFE